MAGCKSNPTTASVNIEGKPVEEMLDRKLSDDLFTNTLLTLSHVKDGEVDKWISSVAGEMHARERLLLGRLRYETSERNIMAIAFLLGRYRTPEAAEPLSKYVSLKNPADNTPDGSLIGRHPVVSALIRIGEPSVPFMLKNLEASTDRLVILFSVRVLRYVRGYESAEVLIKECISGIKDTGQKTRLKVALKEMRN